MKKLYRVVGALVVCGLLGVALPVSAEADAPSRVQRQAYGIVLKLSKAVLGVSDKTVTANATAVGNELAPCLSNLLSSSAPQSARGALGGEIGAQYAATAERPFFKAVITATMQIAKLPPIRPQAKAKLESWAMLTNRVLALDSCADIAAWQAASFAPGSEPVGTQLVSTWVTTPIPNPGSSIHFTARQTQALVPILNRVHKRGNDLDRLLQSLFKAWLAQNGA